MQDLKLHATSLKAMIRGADFSAARLRGLVLEPESLAARAGLTRFAIRLLRQHGDGGLADSLQDDLGQLYVECANSCQDPVLRLQALGWVSALLRDVGVEPALRECEYDWFESLDDRSERILLVAAALADVAIAFDWATGLLRLTGPTGESRTIRLSQTVSAPVNGLVLAGAECRVTILAPWSETAGITHAGTKPRNADALAVCWDGSSTEPQWTAAAVFDGAGSSRDAEIAARCGAQAFQLGISLTMDLPSAIAIAASAIRIANRRFRLDGHATVAAAFATRSRGEVCVVGDAYAAIVPADGGLWRYPVKPADGQAIVGGQPLGQTLTTSGRSVETLSSPPESTILEVSEAQRFILGSDGVRAGGKEREAISVEQALGGAGRAPAVCEAVIAACLGEFARAPELCDNVSVVVLERESGRGQGREWNVSH